MSVADYTPTVDEIGRVLADRTFVKGTLVGSDNNLAGTFTEETRPTKKQVENLRVDALREVRPHVIDNDDTTEEVYDLAKMAVARRTALLIFVSFFSKELEEASNGYNELEKLYEDALALLAGEQDDTGASAKGIYSIPMRSTLADGYCAPDLLP